MIAATPFTQDDSKAPFGRRSWESRLPRFSLRSLLISVTLISIALGALVSYAVPAIRWRRQLIALRDAGAELYLTPARSIPWDWFRPVRPVEQILFATEYDLGRMASDSAMQSLKGLRGVRYLRARGPNVTDLGLEYLSDFESIWLLELDASAVTDEGAGKLAELTTLKMLCLRRTNLSDAGVRKLAALPQLRYVALAGSRITDRSLPLLATCANLREVDLRDTQVTPAGLRDLRAKRPNLLIISSHAPVPENVAQLEP